MTSLKSLLSIAPMPVIAGSIALALAGCASAPDPEVARAEAAVQAARDDQLVQAFAPAAVQEVDHLAYLAEQQAAIAQFRAQEERSQQQVAAVGEQITRELDRLDAEYTERGVIITLGDVLFEVN